MNYTNVGKSGLKVSNVTFGSALTIGTENTTLEYAQKMVDRAWELGIRSFDVANHYGNGEAERLLGKALKKYPRQEYVIATKGCRPMGESPYDQGLSRKHIRWALGQSLQRLSLNVVDIYYAHRYDEETPMEEIVRTFNQFIQEGKILYWATSEWPLSALEECFEVCKSLRLEPPIAEQFIYSYAVEKAKYNGVMEFCKMHGMGMFGFSPLCQGWLTGKYRNHIPEDSRIAKSKSIAYDKTRNFYEQFRPRIDFFLQICDAYSAKPSNVAVLWCIKNGVNPVLGASKPEQLSDTICATLDGYCEKMWEELTQYEGK